MLLSSQLKAQVFTLSVNKLDDFIKEIVRIAPYQSMAAHVLITSTFTNINVRRQGNKYFIGLQSQFYSASKSLEDNAIKKGSKIYFKLQNDTIAQAGYDFEDVQPMVTFDSSVRLWRYNLALDFLIEEKELDKLSKSPAILIRVENGQFTADIEVREKFRNTAPRNYFINFIALLR